MAPSQLQAEARVLAEAFGDLVEALEAVGYDVTRLTLSALASLDRPEVRDAQARLEAYRVERCPGRSADTAVASALPQRASVTI